jgi:DNA-binding XRE family transcriptional regulator
MDTMEKTRKHSSDLAHDALTMAFSILVERIRSLPKDDLQDLSELAKELATAASSEEIESIIVAMREILEQTPIRVRQMEQSADDFDSQPGPGLKKWLDFVSERIRSLRTEAGLTQAQLAERSGLPQSQISRLENGQQSPSRVTIEKIADALCQPVAAFDPAL